MTEVSEVTANIIIIFLTLILGIFLILGLVDIDWMVTTWYFAESLPIDGTWQFTPIIIMNWWDGYIFTISRIVIGAGLIGFSIGRLTFFHYIFKYENTEKILKNE